MRDLRGALASDSPITRREALRRSTMGALVLSTGACLGSSEPSKRGTQDGRVSARAASPTRTIAAGLHPLGLGVVRDGFLYVPTGYKPDTPAPVALLLHGAGRDATEMVDPIRPLADTSGLVLVAPDARFVTWDAISGSFSDDVQFIDQALTWTFDRVRVDASRVRIVGFSDGGSYALSLGLINGDLFSRVVAFSPGFIIDGPVNGKPKIFITHGTRDQVLPVDATSRKLVPQLTSAGYDVEYHEFDGGHGVSNALLGQAMTWASA